MRRPSARLTPNTVTLRRTSFGADAAAGRKIAGGVTDATPRAVSVHPTSAEDLPDHLREQGRVYYTVTFYDDPGLYVRDEVLWDGRVLVVLGVRGSSGGVGRSWPVLTEYKPATASAARGG